MYTAPVTTRAAALPPAQRRAAIVEAALPLFLDRGASVSTREIAEAAGVAEGTIFGVFPDKNAVMHAALQAAIDPQPTEDALAAIDPSQPFEDQLTDAVTVIAERYSRIWRLLSTVHDAGPGPTTITDFPSLTSIMASERENLRTDPASAARQLRALTLAVTNPVFFPDQPLSPREIVTLFLDGMRRPGASPRSGGVA